MEKINKIIDSLHPVEQSIMYNALQKRLNRSPEYTIRCDEGGYYVKCDSSQLNTFRFEKKEYAELTYQIYKNMKPDENLLHYIKYVFRLLNIDSEWTK